MAKDTPQMVRKLITITPEMAEAISDYRHDNRFKTEMEAIRALLDMGLSAKAPRKRNPPPAKE